MIIINHYETKSTGERPQKLNGMMPSRLWNRVPGTKNMISISVENKYSSNKEMKGVESG